MKRDDVAIFRLALGYEIASGVAYGFGYAIILLSLIAPDVPFIQPVPPSMRPFIHPILRPLFAVPLMVLIWLATAFWFRTRYTVRVHGDGVSLYGIRWLPWENVRSAKYRKPFWFTYLQIKQHKGFRLNISLCAFAPGLAAAIIEASPPDSPLRLLSPPER